MNVILRLTCLIWLMLPVWVFGQQADLIFLKYAKDGDASGLVGAFQMGANINARDADGRTAVMLTAMVNDWPHLDSLQSIMGWKPDLDLVDNKG